MPPLSTRSATAEDVPAPGLPDLLPDHWRDGENRRSVVAVDERGRILGHCRGIDNVFHPDSRTCVLEILPDAELGEEDWCTVAAALLTAQRSVSTLPLRLKPTSDDARLVEVCARLGGVLVQLMPPWRYRVDEALLAWADAHSSTPDNLEAVPAETDLREEMLDLYVEHYTAQHARWSPAAAPATLRTENAPDVVPGTEGAYDPERSTVLLREGHLVAQALVWPAEPDGGTEVTLQSRPHEGPTARTDMEACLAAAVLAAPEGTTLLIDSHAGEVLESAMLQDVPGPEDEEWTAIVALPVPGGPAPIPLRDDRVPEAARAFAAALRGER